MFFPSFGCESAWETHLQVKCCNRFKAGYSVIVASVIEICILSYKFTVQNKAYRQIYNPGMQLLIYYACLGEVNCCGQYPIVSIDDR